MRERYINPYLTGAANRQFSSKLYYFPASEASHGSSRAKHVLPPHPPLLKEFLGDGREALWWRQVRQELLSPLCLPGK